MGGQFVDHQPDILDVSALDLTGSQGQRGACLGMQDNGFLVQADGRIGQVIGLRIQVQHILHGRNEVTAYGWDAPLMMLPGFELILFNKDRIVSRAMCSTNPSSTALPASRRSVQWSWPAGASLQARITAEAERPLEAIAMGL